MDPMIIRLDTQYGGQTQIEREKTNTGSSGDALPINKYHKS